MYGIRKINTITEAATFNGTDSNLLPKKSGIVLASRGCVITLVLLPRTFHASSEPINALPSPAQVDARPKFQPNCPAYPTKITAEKYDVPKDDIERSRNCLRYEVQLKRDYLRRKIEPKLKYHKNKYGWEDDWLVDYLMEFRKFIAPILRTTAILMFGEYEFANRKLAEFCVENLYHTGMIGDEDVDLMQDFLAWNETKPEYRRWDFDDEEWKEIHQILNLARLNRTVVPEWLLTEREKNKFPYPPFWKNIQEIKGEQFMPYL